MWEHLSDSKILTVANIRLPTHDTQLATILNTHHWLSPAKMLRLLYKQTSQRSEGGRLTSRLQKQTQSATEPQPWEAESAFTAPERNHNVQPRKQRVSLSRCPWTEGHLRTGIALFSSPCSFQWPFWSVRRMPLQLLHGDSEMGP